jgi:hypothetical protein
MFGIDDIQSCQYVCSFQIDVGVVVVTGPGDTKKLCLTSDGDEGEMYIYKSQFSLMVTFSQAVYIFF